MKERRKFVRVKSDEEVKYKIVSTDSLSSIEEKILIMEAKSIDIGGGGISIETDEEICPGTFLALEIKFKKISHPIFVLGEVVWCKKIGEKYSLGIKFIRIAENDHYKIFEQILEKIIKENI